MLLNRPNCCCVLYSYGYGVKDEQELGRGSANNYKRYLDSFMDFKSFH